MNFHTFSNSRKASAFFFLFFCSVGTNYKSHLENTVLNLSHDIFGGPGEVTDIRVE